MARRFIAGQIEKIEEYLRGKIPDDPDLGRLLVTVLRNPLIREASCGRPVTQLPQDASAEMARDWSACKAGEYPRNEDNSSEAKYYEFALQPMASPVDMRVNQITAWLIQQKKSATLKLDKQGRRPTVLVGIQTLHDAIKNITGQSLPLDIPRSGAMMEWPDGYHFFEVKDVDGVYAAREGLVDQRKEVKNEHHELIFRTVLQGKIRAGNRFYCLRGEPDPIHPTGEYALIEVDSQNTLVECRGRQHQPPTEPAIEYVRQFIAAKRFSLGSVPTKWISLIEKDGNYYNLLKLKDAFPKGLKLDGNLNLSGVRHRFELPSLDITGNLSLRHSRVAALPLIKAKHIDLSRTELKSLGKNREFGGNLDIANTDIVEFNDGTRIQGNLTINETGITRLPRSKPTHYPYPQMTVEGNLTLNSIMESGDGLQTLLDDIATGRLVVDGKLLSRFGKEIEKPAPRIARTVS